MKKFAIILSTYILLGLIFSVSTLAKELDTKDWYLYSSSSSHSFSIRFPKYWQVKTLDNKIANFGPSDTQNPISVQEFDDTSYDSLINFFAPKEKVKIDKKDLLISGNGEKLIAKQAVYKNNATGNSSVITFIRRGGKIVGITLPNKNNKDIYNSMVDSLVFNDHWEQFIDAANNFTFIYPTNYLIDQKDGLTDVKPAASASPILSISKIENFSISMINETKIDYNFNGFNKSAKVSLLNPKTGQKEVSIYLEKGKDVFKLSYNENDKNIQEILSSFDFFELDLIGKLGIYKNFPDVMDSHANAQAINSLYKNGIINGYADGNFKPDGEISRAELTKMIVGAMTQPDLNNYHDCFSDVQKEWFAPYVCYAKANAWVSGFADGKFHPDNKVTRVEAVKIIINGIFNGKIPKEELKDKSMLDININEWYAKYFIFASNRDLLDKQHIQKKASGSLYLPLKNISRKEVAETIYRIKNLPK